MRIFPKFQFQGYLDKGIVAVLPFSLYVLLYLAFIISI
jgi:hypothetical protein